MEKKAKQLRKNEKGNRGTIQIECLQWFTETTNKEVEEEGFVEGGFKNIFKSRIKCSKIFKMQKTSDELDF